MASVDGFIEIAPSNAYVTTDTLADDMIFWTSTSNQRIVFATKSNSIATMYMASNVTVFNSNVGIGKQPTFALDVNGVVNATSLFVGGAPYIGSQWSTSGCNVFMISSNVGIGTSTPNSRLEVSGNALISGSTTTSGLTLSRSGSNVEITEAGHVIGWSNLGADINLFTSGSNVSDAIIFKNGSNVTEKMRITGVGLVGIGITSPASTVHMNSNATAACQLSFTNTPTGNGRAFVGIDTDGHLNLFHTSNNVIKIGTSNVEGMRINSNNYIGIGVSNPTYPLHVVNAATTSIYASGDIVGLSDISVKTDIQQITNALQKIKQISGYTFKRNDTGDNKTRRQAGVIAQEVNEVLPEVISSSTDGKLSVAYGNLTALLIEAIKELDAKVDNLASRL